MYQKLKNSHSHIFTWGENPSNITGSKILVMILCTNRGKLEFLLFPTSEKLSHCCESIKCIFTFLLFKKFKMAFVLEYMPWSHSMKIESSRRQNVRPIRCVSNKVELSCDKPLSVWAVQPMGWNSKLNKKWMRK